MRVDPDCIAGKHSACLGETFDDLRDLFVPCGCECHEATPVPVVNDLRQVAS